MYSGKEKVPRREHKGGNHLGTDNILFHDLGGSYTDFHFMVIYLAIHLVFLHFSVCVIFHNKIFFVFKNSVM